MFHFKQIIKNDPYKPGFEQEWTPLSFLSGFFTPKERKTALILVYALFATTFWVYLPQAPRLFESTAGTSDEVCVVFHSPLEDYATPHTLTFSERFVKLAENSQQIWGALVLFGIIPTIMVKFVFCEKLSDYGLSLGFWRRTRNLVLMFLPLVLVAMYFSGKSTDYMQTYPYNPWILGGYETVKEGWAFMLIYFALYMFCYYLSWEFFFRGFLQLGTEETVGCFNAVFLGVILSTVVHFGPHAMSETLGAICGGMLWGFFVYRTRSIFAGWLMHSALGIGLDFFLLYHFIPWG